MLPILFAVGFLLFIVGALTAILVAVQARQQSVGAVLACLFVPLYAAWWLLHHGRASRDTLMAMVHIGGMVGGAGLLAVGLWMASTHSTLPIERDSLDEDPVVAAQRGEAAMRAASNAARAASHAAASPSGVAPAASAVAPPASELPADEAAEIEKLRREAEGK